MTQIYTTSFGNVFEFSFEKQADGSVIPYILRQPSYGSRNTESQVVHRLHDGSRFYICWKKKLWSESDAKAVAAQWARYTDRYIRTGTPFPTMA